MAWIKYPKKDRVVTFSYYAKPMEGGRNVQFNVLALVEHLKNFIWATPNNIEFPFVSISGYQHPPSLSHLRHSNVSVHLQDHVHLPSTFLGEHSTHRIEGTFSSMHVIIHGRRFMCMRSHSGKIQWKMGCTSCYSPSSVSNRDSRRLLDVRLLN